MHRCIKCGFIVKGDIETIITGGCPQCGSKFFAYTSEKSRAQKPVEDKEHKGHKVEDSVESESLEEDSTEKESVEGVMVKGQGIYEVNLSSLLENESVIVSNEEGRYLIDINSLLKKKLEK